MTTRAPSADSSAGVGTRAVITSYSIHYTKLYDKAGIIEKSGSWFAYNGERIGQGRENARSYLKAHPEVADAIDAAIRANAGIIAGALEGGRDDEAPVAEEA